MTRVLMVRHRNRTNAVTSAVTLTHALAEHGIEVVEDASSGGIDMVLSIGGDGTFLVAASSARALGVPLLGVNAGHMGFLTELGSTGTGDLARKIAQGDFTVEQRMTLDVTMERTDGSKASDWALNEAVMSTPTGSTAYSFSAGGPVVWPDTEAIVVAPLAAHGLFTRPLVVGPSACVEIVVLDDMWTAPEMWCDGLRRMTVPAGAVVRARVGSSPVQLVRVDDTPFSARLVRKFNLPVRGWRDGPR